MAVIAALAHVDVAAGKLEGCVRSHAVNLLDRALQVKQRRDLDEPAERDHDQHADQQDDRVLLEDRMLLPERHLYHSAGTSLGASAGSDSPAFTVCQRFHTIKSAPARNSAPPIARMT